MIRLFMRGTWILMSTTFTLPAFLVFSCASQTDIRLAIHGLLGVVCQTLPLLWKTHPTSHNSKVNLESKPTQWATGYLRTSPSYSLKAAARSRSQVCLDKTCFIHAATLRLRSASRILQRFMRISTTRRKPWSDPGS